MSGLPTPAQALCALRLLHSTGSSSQNAEDLLLVPTLLRAAGGGPGTFVEMGALDGLTYSNTLVLERCFNWTGVLLEANPANYAKLLRSKRANNAKLVHAAVCKEGEHVEISAQGGPVRHAPPPPTHPAPF